MVYRTSNELGEREREFRPSRLLAAGIYLAAMASPLMGILMTIGAFAETRRDADALVQSAVVLVFGPAVLFWWLRTRRQRAELYTEGVAHWRGAAPWTTRWERVVRVFASHTKFHLLLPTQHTYTLERDDGSRTELTSALAGVWHLGTAIEQRTLKHMLPRAYEMLGRGEPVYFGPVAVTPQAIGYAGNWQPWTSVRDVSVANGELVIALESKLLAWAKVSYPSIANGHVLLALIPELRAAAAAAQARAS